MLALSLGGCLGKGGAVSVRWRISERQTGKLYDPRDVSDDNGTCCQPLGGAPCSGSPAWKVDRVRVVLADSNTGREVAVAGDGGHIDGTDAGCGSRELTTPFSLPEGLFAVSLRAYDPAAPDTIEAESPAPAIRTVRKAEIVNLDVVELEVSTTP